MFFAVSSPHVFKACAPVAQLDRVLDYESRGQEFESLRAHHFTFHIHFVFVLIRAFNVRGFLRIYLMFLYHNYT